jgi:hypothetical protein
MTPISLLLGAALVAMLVAIPRGLHAQIDTTFVPATSSDTTASPLGAPATATQIAPLHADTAVYPMFEQPDKRIIRFGMFGGAGFSMQDAQLGFPGIQLLGGGECQCSFTSGVGIGAGGAIGLSMSYNDDRWSQGLRLSLANNTSRSLRHDSAYFAQLGGLPPKLEVTEEQFDLSNTSLGLELLFTYRLPLLKDLFVIAGPSINLLVSNKYSITLVDESSTTKPVSGKLEDTENVYTAITGGLGARLGLGDSNVALQPEVLYTYPLDRLSRKYSWSFTNIRANLGLVFTL